jgi:IS5 family transposase
MYLLQSRFNLSDEGTEEAIYDSYAFERFMGIDFTHEQAPDATRLCKFRKLLNDNGRMMQVLASPKNSHTLSCSSRV